MFGILRNRRSRDICDANVDADWIGRRAPDAEGWGPPENAVRGESLRQEAIEGLPGVSVGFTNGRCDLVAVELRRDPSNPVDRHACRALIAGVHVGYLAKEYAAELSPIVDKARIQSWTVAGAVVGHAKRAQSYGVHVWLDRRLTPGPRPPTVPLLRRSNDAGPIMTIRVQLPPDL